MKWMLVVIVFTGQPISTGLVFDTLDDCLSVSDEMRSTYADAYNKWLKWARDNPKEAAYPKSESYMQNRIGISNQATCIPTH